MKRNYVGRSWDQGGLFFIQNWAVVAEYVEWLCYISKLAKSRGGWLLFEHFPVIRHSFAQCPLYLLVWKWWTFLHGNTAIICRDRETKVIIQPRVEKVEEASLRLTHINEHGNLSCRRAVGHFGKTKKKRVENWRILLPAARLNGKRAYVRKVAARWQAIYYREKSIGAIRKRTRSSRDFVPYPPSSTKDISMSQWKSCALNWSWSRESNKVAGIVLSCVRQYCLRTRAMLSAFSRRCDAHWDKQSYLPTLTYMPIPSIGISFLKSTSASEWNIIGSDAHLAPPPFSIITGHHHHLVKRKEAEAEKYTWRCHMCMMDFRALKVPRRRGCPWTFIYLSASTP